MTTPLSSFSGLISGFNYKDLVDEIMRVEGRPVDRMKAESAGIAEAQKALTTYRGLMDKLRTAAQSFRSGLALEATSATTSIEAGARALATATSSSIAVPGSYSLEVQQLARAQKLGGSAKPDSTTALGLSGSFTINGATVTVAAGDSLGAIRDKINAQNTGSSATKVAASILTVAPGQHQLVLTSGTAGDAGIALAETTGTPLQSLGFLDGAGALAAGVELVEGKDALFSIDGVDFVRNSNVISDAVSGLTLTLVGEEVGARTGIRVDRYGDSAHTSAQTFVDAYNGLMAFLKAQGTATNTSRPALYGDNLLRTARSALPGRILESVFGAAPDLATASAAGISFSRDGSLTLDGKKFDEAFKTRYQDLKNVFIETRSASDANVTLVSGGGLASSGSFAVNITAAATRGTLVSTGFAGSYDAGATPDTLTITDNQIGKSAQVILTTGMTTADIVTAMQTAFDAQGLSITASAEGNEVRLYHDNYGSLSGLTVVNAGAGDGAAELWAATDTDYGTDVAGSLGGHAATGSGQTLVGNTGTAAAGLTVSYAGSGTGAAGTVTLALGVGALVERLLDTYTQAASGSIARRSASLTDRVSTLEKRISTLESRLAERRANMLKRYNQMEVALGRLQKQTQSLTGLLKPSSS